MRIPGLAIILLLARALFPWQAVSAQEVVDSVVPRAVADEVLRIFNATSTLRVTGPYTIEASREVSSDVAIFGGTLIVEGLVKGHIVAVNASIRLDRGSRIEGAIIAVGGNVTGGDVATVTGGIRTYAASLDVLREGERLVRRGETEPAGQWWRRPQRWSGRAWSDLRLVSARTYNRVEGLPVFLGPTFGRELGWGRLSSDVYGVIRSADGFEWKEENVGHSVRMDLQLGRETGVRLGGRLFDLVDPVEPWQLSDPEVGLAAFFLHRDLRDYYNKHGGSLSAGWFRGSDLDVTLSYSDQRWASRRTRDPWTVFRDTEGWRPNPQVDEGVFHVANATLRFDTRNDDNNPWSGWYLTADYEYGTGKIDRYAPTSPGVREPTVLGETSYDRLFFDLRRYNRISPDRQLNFRLVAGGWLSGDDLPLQRRFSLGGPGTLPGYDFKHTGGAVDYWQCSTSPAVGSGAPAGVPAQCERFALAQVEYRGDMHFDPFGVLDEERELRRSGWGRGTQFVFFADAGRGWLVGPDDGKLVVGRWQFPSLSTFRTDVGVGIVLDDVGVYFAKALSNWSAPLNVIVRLKPRF
jgi:hypothetical protein